MSQVIDRLGSYVSLAKNAKAVLEKEHDSSNYHDFMTAAEGFFEENEWILCFNVDSGNAKWAAWMFAHHIVEVSPSDKRAYETYAPYQVIQVYPLSTISEPPPFLIDTKFKLAFRAAVKQFGMKRIIDMTTGKPPKRLIDLVYGYYR